MNHMYDDYDRLKVKSYDQNMIIAPSDGYISEIKKLDDAYKIYIPLKFSDGHVQYAPFSGKIAHNQYYPGKFRPIFLFDSKNLLSTKTTENNAQTVITIDTKYGPIKVQLIAGLLARRTFPLIEIDQDVQKHQPIGYILYGSLVIVTIPKSAKLLVKTGDRIQGNITNIARFS